MKKIRVFLTVFLIILGCITSECIAGAAMHKVSGVVADTGGSPVNNAKVCVQGN